MQDVGSTGGFSLSPFAHSKHLLEREREEGEKERQRLIGMS